MHRHMRRVGDKGAMPVEHGAGEVEPLLDVDRIGGVLQRHAHLLGDRHEEVIEDFEHHRIGLRADRLALRRDLHARHHDMVLRRDPGAPAVFDHDRLMRLDDERGPVDARADRQRLAQENVGLPPRALGEEPRPDRGRRRAGRRDEKRPFGKTRGAADRFRRHRLDHQRLGRVDEAEPRLVRRLEGAPHGKGRGELDLDRGVGAGVAKLRPSTDFDVGSRDALRSRLREPRCSASASATRPTRAVAPGVERLVHALRPLRGDVGEPHAVGRKQRRQRMDQHGRDRERVGDVAGVLAAGAAERVQRVARHVVAAGDRDRLDRLRHLGDGDGEKAVGDRLGRAAVADR